MIRRGLTSRGDCPTLRIPRNRLPGSSAPRRRPNRRPSSGTVLSSSSCISRRRRQRIILEAFVVKMLSIFTFVPVAQPLQELCKASLPTSFGKKTPRDFRHGASSFLFLSC